MKTTTSTNVYSAFVIAAGLTLPASAGLVGHYTFDTDFTDSAGSRDGVGSGSASIDNTNYAPDPNGSTGSLNLTNGGYVALPSTDTGTYNEYTLSLWLKIDGQSEPLGAIYTTGRMGPRRAAHES